MQATKEQKDQKLTPEPLLQMQFAMSASRVLVSSAQLGIFTHVANGAKTPAAVAKAAGCQERGARMLLDALCAFGLATKSGGSYGLTPLSAEYLVKGKDSYMGAMMESDLMWDSWTHLTDIVKNGQPEKRVESKKDAEAFFPTLVRSLHVMNKEPARRTAEILKGAKSVLDVACGSGIWGISCAEADKSVKMTASDFPGVLEVTKEYAKKHGVADRVDYLPGDLKTVDYGKEKFDAAILGNIVHSEGEKSSRALFKKLHAALKPGGKCVIVDMVPNDERTGPPFPVLFAINMLLHTTEGDVYTLAEYRAWLEDAGFKRVETADIGSHSPLVIGIK
jgi:ubiquinone/menaquinone biosynthesis C-methylase UbiE